MTPGTPFQHVDAAGARALLDRPDLRILDTRDEAAFLAGHIDGAENVSIRNLSWILEATSRTAPVLIYCYHGFASQEFAQIFVDFRFQEVYSLDGGYESWAASGAEQDAADDMTPLMRAASTGRADMVRSLLDAGADPEEKTAEGFTAMGMATNLECLALLSVAMRRRLRNPAGRAA